MNARNGLEVLERAARMDTRGAVGELCTRKAADFGPAADQLRVQLRAVGSEGDGPGGFEGWGCVFDVEDSYGTTFAPGCFIEGGLEETPYPLLWMHSPYWPIATFSAVERHTDTVSGLWVAGEYDDTDEGQRARGRAASGSAPELSVGFIWLTSDEDDENRITGARLVETSQITLRFAAVPGAQITGVRDDDQPDPRLAMARASARLRLAQAIEL